jgi:uncharacterized glyoxalase superfamily metalloenzyme YdcJ
MGLWFFTGAIRNTFFPIIQRYVALLGVREKKYEDLAKAADTQRKARIVSALTQFQTDIFHCQEKKA